MTDIVILGAGVIGLSVACELAKRGAAVTVLERGDFGRGASWAAGGMLAPFTEELPPGRLRELALESLALYPAFARELHERSGIDIHLQKNGILEIAFDELRLQELHARAQRLKAAGFAADALSRSELFGVEAAISPQALGGILCAAEGQVENRRLGRALFGSAIALGVDIRQHMPVLALEANARRVLGVRTADGFLGAGVVVNTLGAWAGDLAGVPPGSRVSVYPVKGQMLALALPQRYLSHVLWTPGAYLIPRRDGRLVIGATVEAADFDMRITAGGIGGLLTAAVRAMPGAASFALCETWVGHRPATPDGEPILRAMPLEGYFVAAGHYRNGILLAPISGRYMADLITAGVAGIEPERA